MKIRKEKNPIVLKNTDLETTTDFSNIVQLIQEARNRAFSKVNEELVQLYYHVGSIVSAKVATGVWGDGTVNELANFIDLRIPGIGGFNRRGLYRMKQFYETYAVGSDCYSAWLNIQVKKKQNSIVSPAATQLKRSKLKKIEIVS